MQQPRRTFNIPGWKKARLSQKTAHSNGILQLVAPCKRNVQDLPTCSKEFEHFWSWRIDPQESGDEYRLMMLGYIRKGQRARRHWGNPRKVPASAVLQRMQRAFLFGLGLWSSEEANCSWDICNWGQRSSGKNQVKKRKQQRKHIETVTIKAAFARFLMVPLDPFGMLLASTPTGSRTSRTHFKLIHVPACCI